jgi:hypothetical protein
MSEIRRFSLVKPTLQTPLHIDFDWWKEHDSSWRVYLRSYLCPEHQEKFENVSEDTLVDYVDPETAEVHRVDGLQHVLMSHCARQDGFITENTALVDAVFRTFLANGNQPLNSLELEEALGKPAQTILRTLAGVRIYKGIRPSYEDMQA